MKILNGLVLAATLTLATVGAAQAGLVTSDQRYFLNEVHAVSDAALTANAQASMDPQAALDTTGAYQGGPKTGTGFAR
jgi:hypothetical protein